MCIVVEFAWHGINLPERYPNIPSFLSVIKTRVKSRNLQRPLIGLGEGIDCRGKNSSYVREWYSVGSILVAASELRLSFASPGKSIRSSMLWCMESHLIFYIVHAYLRSACISSLSYCGCTVLHPTLVQVLESSRTLFHFLSRERTAVGFQSRDLRRQRVVYSPDANVIELFDAMQLNA